MVSSEHVMPTLVYRPGGVAGGGVLTSWADLYDAATKTAGPKTVEIDDPEPLVQEAFKAMEYDKRKRSRKARTRKAR